MDEREPIAAPDSERETLTALDRALKSEGGETPALLLSNGEQIALPASLAAILRRATHELARDRAVQLFTVGRELTTQQAADLLNVSRPYLIQLLDEGKIPHHLVGTHRRVPLDALLAFARRMYEEQGKALDEMLRLSQEWGMYDTPVPEAVLRTR